MKIPPKRLMAYCLLFSLIPLLLIGMHLINKRSHFILLENALESCQLSFIQHERKHAQNRAIREYFQHADHFYIDKHLETTRLLEEEVEMLRKITSHGDVGQIESITKRLNFLSSANALQFVESGVHIYPFFQETTETLSHSVEVALDDVKNILAKTEGVEMGDFSPAPDRPQLIITDFKIEKKQIRDKNEVFVLNMKLIKREYQ